MSIGNVTRGFSEVSSQIFTASNGWSKLNNYFVDQKLAKLSSSAVRVYLVLLRRSDRHGVSWPSIANISALAGIGSRMVTISLNELEVARLVRRAGQCGRGNRYRLEQEPAQPTAPIESDPLRPPAQPIAPHPRNPLPTNKSIDPDPIKNTQPTPNQTPIHLLKNQTNPDDLFADLSDLTDDDLDLLKQEVLAKINPVTAKFLKKSIPRTSPTLASLIRNLLSEK